MMDADTAICLNTAGQVRSAERARRLQQWAAFINGELSQRGLRPGQFAAYANVSTSSVSLWQRGRSLPSGEAVVRIAHFLRLPLEAVAARAGMVPAMPPCVSYTDTDPEWRVLLAELAALPPDELREIAQALRVVLHAWDRRRAG